MMDEYKPIPGCTVSKQILRTEDMSISIFSLGEGTSISPESYEYHKLWILCKGCVEVLKIDSVSAKHVEGESTLTPLKEPVGVRAIEDSIYIEVEFGKETIMNNMIKAGEVFKLGELVPYQDGRIVNMDLASNSKMKFVIMSFDEGTGLSEHAAPGEALVLALDGEGVIGYEGEEHVLHAGETFKFDKFGKHSVTARKKFKMALLLVLDEDK